MNFKNKILVAVATLGLALAVRAALPTYITKSATGTAAAPSTIIFPDDPNSQIRLLSINFQSDTNNAQLQLSSGVGAYSLTATNALTTTVTNYINSTNGLTASGVLVLNHGGTCYAATISSWSQSTNTAPGTGTNVVLASGGWGVLASVGDSVYLMSSTIALNTGAATNAQNGEAIYVGNYGRPVMVKLTPALSTNALPAVTAHYDQLGM